MTVAMEIIPNITGRAEGYAQRITASGLSIYAPIEVGSDLWIPSDVLEVLLQNKLDGLSLASVPLRTRSKLVKAEICRALGYPVPASFTKVQPRFPGQNFDTYVQAADNLQIWNEEISPSRRYVLIRPDSQGVVRRVRVVTGADLAPLDRTGRLTRKYQARVSDLTSVSLASSSDTSNLSPVVALLSGEVFGHRSPIELPEVGLLQPIARVFERLSPLVGRSFVDPGILQERNRGGQLHALVSDALGYGSHADNGKFPDVRHQLLEVKLQTSPTIDLGAISPDSSECLEFPAVGGVHIRHQDVRYAVFCGVASGAQVTITGLTLVTGLDFYGVFERFGGLVINNKYQMKLPGDFFERNTEGLFD